MFGITKSGKKQVVGLAVTQNLGLEAAVYDTNSNEVIKYGKKLLDYNIASRSIQDPNAFRAAVSDLFNELELSYENSNVFLVLPNVYSGFRSIEDSFVDDAGIESIVAAEATESYIFKQEDATCAFKDMNENQGVSTKYIFYSAIQTKVVEDIQDAIIDVGGTIVGIESAVSAIPRGIALTGICQKEIENNENWDILLANSNNYAIFQMCGSRVLDYIEVPFAIMSFEGEDVYPALASAVAQYLPNYPAKKLVVVSQTDNVVAKILKNAIVFDYDIIAIDSNTHGTEPCVNVSPQVIKQLASSMSLSVLGASVPKLGDFATLNVMHIDSFDGSVLYGSIEIGGRKFDITSDFVKTASILLCILAVAVSGVLIGLLLTLSSVYANKATEQQGKIDGLNSEITQLNNKIKANVGAIAKKINANNIKMLNFYDSLSTDIPSKVWLTYFISKNGGEVGIEGLSVDINDIYAYFRSLKMLALNSDIKLNKLEVFQDEPASDSQDADQIVLNEDNGQQTFSFQISNTTYEKSFDESGNRVSKDENSQNGTSSSDSSGTTSTSSTPPSVPDVDASLKEAK